MDTRQRTALVALFVSALVASAARPAWAQTAPESGAEEEAPTTLRPWETPATLRVQSNNWLDLHLYLVRDGTRRSLGVVSGPGAAELELPHEATMPGSLVQILVEPIGGGGSYLSQALLVSPGDRVDLTVQNNLRLSSESLGRR